MKGQTHLPGTVSNETLIDSVLPFWNQESACSDPVVTWRKRGRGNGREEEREREREREKEKEKEKYLEPIQKQNQ